MYLIARRSKDTKLQSSECHENHAGGSLRHKWSALSGIQLADGKVIATALVHHSQYFITIPSPSKRTAALGVYKHKLNTPRSTLSYHTLY
jgi:hypothetical protein